MPVMKPCRLVLSKLTESPELAGSPEMIWALRMSAVDGSVAVTLMGVMKSLYCLVACGPLLLTRGATLLT